MEYTPAFKPTEKRFPVSFRCIQTAAENPDVEIYDGEYEVTPKVEAQTVPTAQKYMTADMKVKAIPIYDVSNASGGNTIFIASEV